MACRRVVRARNARLQVEGARMPDLVKSCSRTRPNGKEGTSHHPSPRACAATPASARRHVQTVAALLIRSAGTPMRYPTPMEGRNLRGDSGLALTPNFCK